MAEVTKNKKKKKYDLEEIKEEIESNKKTKKKKEEKKEKTDKKKENDSVEKKSLWVRFRIFCHGVKSEFQKVHWTGKNDMIKYSIATIISVLCLSIFFYVIDILFAFLQSLF